MTYGGGQDRGRAGLLSLAASHLTPLHVSWDAKAPSQTSGPCRAQGPGAGEQRWKDRLRGASCLIKYVQNRRVNQPWKWRV